MLSIHQYSHIQRRARTTNHRGQYLISSSSGPGYRQGRNLLPHHADKVLPLPWFRLRCRADRSLNRSSTSASTSSCLPLLRRVQPAISDPWAPSDLVPQNPGSDDVSSAGRRRAVDRVCVGCGVGVPCGTRIMVWGTRRHSACNTLTIFVSRIQPVRIGRNVRRTNVS
jgi:hypothetical protein